VGELAAVQDNWSNAGSSLQGGNIAGGTVLAEEVYINSGGGAVDLQKLMGKWAAILTAGSPVEPPGDPWVSHEEPVGPVRVGTTYADRLAVLSGARSCITMVHCKGNSPFRV
jgi:hypothetical protein